MPRVEGTFEDFVLTGDGILLVTFVSGPTRFFAFLEGMRRKRDEFYAQYMDTSPVGLDNVRLIPWSDVTSVRIHTDLVGSGRRKRPETRFDLAAGGDIRSVKIDPRILSGLTSMLQRNLGDRFENAFDQNIYDAYR